MIARPPPMDSSRGEVSKLVRLSSDREICWLCDQAGILVFHPAKHKYWLLVGLEADLWSWLVLGHSLDQITHSVALLMDTGDEAARQKIFEFLRYLIREEMLGFSM
jgi:hypothetical protein